MRPHELHGRLFMTQGFAEVARHGMAEKPPVLHQERSVQAEFVAEPLHVLPTRLLRQEEDSRVAGQTHDHKDQRRNAPQDNERPPDTADEIGVHGLCGRLDIVGSVPQRP